MVETIKQGLLASHVSDDQILYSEGSALITSQVLITSYIGQYYRFLDTQTPNETTGINYPIAELIMIAIRGIHRQKAISRQHILLDVDDWLKHRLVISNKDYQSLNDKSKERWFKETSFCICITDENEQVRYQLMLDHLNKYFGDRLNIRGSYENREVKCYNLVRTSKNAEVAANKYPDNSTDTIGIEDSKPSNFVDLINSSDRNFLEYPIADETGYNKNVNIRISNDLSDIESINRKLAVYNLKLIEAVRELGMVVISSTA